MQPTLGRLAILSVMINIALNAICHIISGILRKFTPHTRAMGRFSDVMWYDLIITDRTGRLVSYGDVPLF